MRIYNIVQNVILTSAVIVIASMGFLIYTMNMQPFIVVSGSMEPEIKTGSICFVDRDDKDVKPEDIAAYELNGITVIHRVVRIEADGAYTMKGDNNDTEDPGTVAADQIKGKFVFAVPAIGYAVNALKSTEGMIFAAGIMIVFFIVNIVMKKKI